MAEIEYADPLRDIGTAWYYSHSHNSRFQEDMSREVRLYQRLKIDADSHPDIIGMEKDLGKNLLQNARLTLLMTLKAVSLPYELDLQYSDQGNKIGYGMKVGSFSFGYCLVHADDIHQDNKRVPIANSLGWIGRLYAAAYIDTYGNQKVMYLFDYHNKQCRLLEEVKHEVGKYEDTLGSPMEYLLGNRSKA
jgi:hypothetical protein